MKFLLISIFVFLMCSVSYAAVNCTNVIHLNFSTSGFCNEGPPPEYPFSLPDSCTAEVAENHCLATVYNVCCDLDVVVSYRDDVSSSEVITGVLQGNEAEVAQQRFLSWKSGVSLNPPQPGFYLSGQFEGYIYSSRTSVSGEITTVDVDITMWKRGFYDKNGSTSGTVIPIENIGSGSGGGSGGGSGSIDLSGTYTNPYSPGTTFANPYSYIVNPSYVNNYGYFISPIPYSYDMLPYSSVTDNSDVLSFGSKTFSQVFTDFVNNIRSTSLFSFSNSLFSVPSGGSSVININAGIYGNHSFDFSDKFSSLFPYIRALVLLGFSAVAVKIILLKGGS